MLNLHLPESTEYPAAVFTQNGEFIMVGHKETCEGEAEKIGGLYCWIINGKPVIRHDFERLE